VVIDFLIVVIGVFLGIQASNWNQARVDRNQAREYRAMLRDDLDDNLANLADRRKYYQWVRSEALATLAELNRPASELSERFLIDSYQASQMQPWALKRSTYDEIVSTGSMAKIGTPMLREQIANYYVSAEVTGVNISALPAYRENLRRVMPYPVQQAIRTRCNERVVQDLRGVVRVIVPGACRLDLDPAVVQLAVTQVRDWPGLELDLNRWLVDVDQKILSVDLIADRARKLKTLLEQADR
jgi:hypothetical protein